MKSVLINEIVIQSLCGIHYAPQVPHFRIAGRQDILEISVRRMLSGVKHKLVRQKPSVYLMLGRWPLKPNLT